MREDEMVAAILADPDLTGLRMVYADWLQSQGDPLGEHIALCLEAERLPLHDPKLTTIWNRVKQLDCFVRAVSPIRDERAWPGLAALTGVS